MSDEGDHPKGITGVRGDHVGAEEGHHFGETGPQGGEQGPHGGGLGRRIIPADRNAPSRLATGDAVAVQLITQVEMG